MKWFKHHSDASLNDKIGKLESEMGLVGYACYFKIVELCASNWDEVSYPEFSFSLKQIQNKLRMKSKQTDLVLGLFQELNLFQITKSENEVKIIALKLAEIKGRYQKKSTENPHESNTNKNKNKNKEKDKEEEKKEIEKPATHESNLIPSDILNTIKIQYQYPDHVIEEVRKDAWLKFIASDDPKKDWRRWIANYFKNEKDKIRNAMIDNLKKQDLAIDNSAEIINRIINNSHLDSKRFQELFTENELDAIRSVGGSRSISNANSFDLARIKKELKTILSNQTSIARISPSLVVCEPDTNKKSGGVHG